MRWYQAEPEPSVDKSGADVAIGEPEVKGDVVDAIRRHPVGVVSDVPGVAGCLEFAGRGKRAIAHGHLGLRVAIDLEHVAAGGHRRCGDGQGGDDAIPWPHGDLICWSRTC